MPGKQTKRAGRRYRQTQRSGAESTAKPSAEEALVTQESLLARIARGAVLCRQLEAQLRQHPAPEVETIIKLYRVLLLKLSVEVQETPDLRHLVATLVKPVMDWARIEEKRQDREWLREKHRDAVAGRDAARGGRTRHEAALSAETLEKIERELKLF